MVNVQLGAGRCSPSTMDESTDRGADDDRSRLTRTAGTAGRANDVALEATGPVAVGDSPSRGGLGDELPTQRADPDQPVRGAVHAPDPQTHLRRHHDDLPVRVAGA